MNTLRKKTFERSGGFTLLEVAISLAIIAVVFVALTNLFNMTIGLSDYSKKLTVATMLAQKIMTEKELSNDFLIEESEEIELEDEYKGYSYRTKIKETIFPFIMEVNLTVYFESVFKKHSINVTSYVSVIEEASDKEKDADDEES